MHKHLLSWSTKRPMKACEPHKGIGLGTKEMPVRFLALEIKTWIDCWSVENVVHTVRNKVTLLHSLVMPGDKYNFKSFSIRFFEEKTVFLLLGEEAENRSLYHTEPLCPAFSSFSTCSMITFRMAWR